MGRLVCTGMDYENHFIMIFSFAQSIDEYPVNE